MNKKNPLVVNLFLTIIFIFFGSLLFANSASALVCATTPNPQFGFTCPVGKSWCNLNAASPAACATETTCPANPANGTYTLSCSNNTCNLTCTGGYTKCGAVCTINGSAANCTVYNTCGAACTTCAAGFELVGGVCNGATLKLGNDSVSSPYLINSLSPALSILANGYVGIGITAPTQKLHIGGVTQFDFKAYGVGPGRTELLGLTTVGFVLDEIASSVGGASLWTKSGTNIFPSTLTGNVGIGTTNPGSGSSFATTKLDVVGDVHLSRQSSKIYFGDVSAVNPLSIGEGLEGDGGLDKDFMSIYPRTKLVILSGNVGIGTTNPTQKLHVAGHSQFDDVAYGVSPGSGELLAFATVGYVNASLGPNNGTTTAGGDLNMGSKNILAVNKLTVVTIDPLYNIKGINYSTFASSIAGGVKEEYVGKKNISVRNVNGEYESLIDFDKEEVGSDLWVWRHTVDFSDDNVQILMTPSGKFAQTYYTINNNQIILRADKPVTVSYRLIGRRIDWLKWPTKAIDQTEKAGFIIN